MGKSAKAKKEKKKDFQKAKLKVGKTKPKASNATDTSFKARCKITNTEEARLAVV
jgi:pre-rRNA-processing protein IPI1